MKKIIIFFIYFTSISLYTGIPSISFAEKAKQSDRHQYIEKHRKQHLILIAGSYIDNVKQHYRELIDEVSNKEFLTKKASESDNPLAPCALLANAAISVRVHYSGRYQIAMKKEFPAPPRGTNTFGKYDDVVAQNSFFNQSPEIQADMLARLHILLSGSIDTILNSFIHDLSQLQCLEHLLVTNFDSLSDQIWDQSNIKVLPHGALHYTAVEMLGSTYKPNEIVNYIKEVQDPKSLKIPGSETKNPLMPCSLLRAYMSAHGIERLWYGIKTDNVFIPGEKANFLGQYRDLVKGGRIPTDDKIVAAKIAALYFTNQIIYTDKKSSAMINQATQQECLEEFINPRGAH